jgi:outer membrane protein assembly factor BamB
MNEQQQQGRNKACLDAGQLIAWRDGALPPQEAHEATAHLAICVRCAAEERALMRDQRQAFELLSSLDPLPGTYAGVTAAFARFQVHLIAGSTGLSIDDDNENRNQAEFPPSKSRRQDPVLIPRRSSTRMHRFGALVQTLAAVLIVVALLGASFLLFQHRLPSTGNHLTGVTQTHATTTARVLPTARATAASYDSFVTINGIMFGFDARHTHVNPYERILNPTTVGGLTKKWAFPTGGSVLSSPIVANGVVYIGCVCGYVYALDIASGAKKWAYHTGGQVASLPAVVGGVVYIGSIEDHTFYALNAASGTRKWAYKAYGPFISSPTVVDGVVYVGSEDNTLYALDAASGAKKWTYWTRGGIDSSPAVADGVVYIGSNDGNVYALDAISGVKKWAYHTGDLVYSSPAVVDGVVYIGSNDGNVYALDAISGVKEWAYYTGGPVGSSPAIANGVVYVGSHDGTLYALEAASGAKKWTYWTSNGVDTSPTVANGVVYFGSLDGHLYALDAVSGETKWVYRDSSSIASSPAVAAGVVYYGSYDGNLYAFHLPGT